MGESIQSISSYNPGQSNATIDLTTLAGGDPGYLYNSSLPTQVFKLYSSQNEPTTFSRTIGDKVYEINDHLGNVRVVLSDFKRLSDENNDDVINAGDYFTPVVVAYNDYYSAGC